MLKKRVLNTSLPHSDAWSDGPWGMNCFIPLFGDYKSAFYDHIAYSTLSEKLAIDEKLEEIDLAKTQFDFTLQEKEKEMLSASLDAQSLKVTQRNRLLMLAAVLVVGMVAFAGYWYRQHQLKRRQNKRIQMLMHSQLLKVEK